MPINIPGLTEDDLASLAVRILRIDGTGWETYSQDDENGGYVTFAWNDHTVVSYGVRGDGTWGIGVYTGDFLDLGKEYMVYFGV
jgi:hypothetical protein